MASNNLTLEFFFKYQITSSRFEGFDITVRLSRVIRDMLFINFLLYLVQRLSPTMIIGKNTLNPSTRITHSTKKRKCHQKD